VSSINLGDSSGLIVNVDKSNSILETYYKDNDYIDIKFMLFWMKPRFLMTNYV
jgi:hypothetical protein